MNTALGFRVKSGWAAMVLLSVEISQPVILDARRIELSDPSEPESVQPYHAMENREKIAGKRESERLVKAVMRVGVKSVASLIENYRSEGHKILGARLVVGSLTDPSQIKNEHIQWHALEGQLFRKVVEEGLKTFRVPFQPILEKELYEQAAASLKQPEKGIRQKLALIGRSQNGPWRSEQKAACLAAWIALSKNFSKKRT